jgi:hypothetical protein
MDASARERDRPLPARSGKSLGVAGSWQWLTSSLGHTAFFRNVVGVGHLQTQERDAMSVGSDLCVTPGRRGSWSGWGRGDATSPRQEP